MSRSNTKSQAAEEVEFEFSTGEDFEKLLESSYNDIQKEGTVTAGTVIGVENDIAIIDIGAKNEGYIAVREFVEDGKVEVPKVGDKIEVYIEKLESRNGRTVLSREKALREEYWIELEKLLDANKTVNGRIFGKVKGGFTVDLNGVIAFLPGSQVDIRPVRDITPLMNIEQPFQILKIDREQGNIVVSRRAIMEESRTEARNELLSQINEGQIMEGVVKNITDYGAFVDLGCMDGLLHVTDISWGRINHPSEILTLGQTIKVQVIKYNPESRRISLGMKQLEDNPWEGIESRYPKGNKFKGKITNITDYGAFVELEPGIEGLVHVSEISWAKNSNNPKKLLTPNQEVEFVVLDIEPGKHRISLGMKQCSNNPWRNFADSHPVNSEVEGSIRNIVDFGIFVGFGEDIDGLVHVSDIAWNEAEAEEKLKGFKKDEAVTIKVLSIDVDKERISLGIKQLTEDPMAGALKGIKKGSIVTCSVKAVTDDGIEVELSNHLMGFIKKTDLSSDKVERRPDRFAVGDRVDAKVSSIDKASSKLTLSIKSLELEQQKKAIAEYGSTDSGASLGDILGAAISKADAKKETKTETKKKAAPKAKADDKTKKADSKEE